MIRRVRIAGLVYLLTTSVVTVFAQPQPGGNNPIDDRLLRAKDEYVDTLTKARGELLKQFEKESDRVKNSTLDVKQKIALNDALDADQKRFEADGTLPSTKSPLFKKAVESYSSAVSGARKQCEKVFSSVAGEVFKTDVNAAKKIVADGEEFLLKTKAGVKVPDAKVGDKGAALPVAPKGIEGVVRGLLTGSTWVYKGKGKYEFTADGKVLLQPKREGKYTIDPKTGNVDFTWQNNQFPGEGLLYDKATQSFRHNNNKGGVLVPEPPAKKP